MATNAEWMIQHGHKFSDLNVRYKGPGEYTSFVVQLNGEKLDEFELGGGQTFIEFALKKWLDMEHKEQILDDAEKRYLSAVIKPFRDRVKRICKVNYLGVSSSEYQRIYITLSDNSHDIDLPLFKKETMYKGMEIGKKYTPEELGL